MQKTSEVTITAILPLYLIAEDPAVKVREGALKIACKPGAIPRYDL